MMKELSLLTLGLIIATTAVAAEPKKVCQGMKALSCTAGAAAMGAGFYEALENPARLHAYRNTPTHASTGRNITDESIFGVLEHAQNGDRIVVTYTMSNTEAIDFERATLRAENDRLLSHQNPGEMNYTDIDDLSRLEEIDKQLNATYRRGYQSSFQNHDQAFKNASEATEYITAHRSVLGVPKEVSRFRSAADQLKHIRNFRLRTGGGVLLIIGGAALTMSDAFMNKAEQKIAKTGSKIGVETYQQALQRQNGNSNGRGGVE